MGISSLSSKSGRAGGQRQGGPVDSSRAGKPGQAGKEGGSCRLPPFQADPPARLPRPAPWTRRVWGHIRLPGPRLPLSMELTSLCFELEGPGKKRHAKLRRQSRVSLFSQNTWAAVRALASQGGEATLEPALHSTGPVQTSAGCLHPFAAAAHIPVVALPTGSAVSIPRRQTPCQENFFSIFMWIFPVFSEKERKFIPVFQPRTERPEGRRPPGKRPPAVPMPIPEGIAPCEKICRRMAETPSKNAAAFAPHRGAAAPG